MSHLPRQEILIRLLHTQPPLLEDVAQDPDELEESVQPDSFDLRIGFIAARGRPVVGDGKQEYMLPPGEMAIVLTKESVNLPLDLAGEVSPPNYLLSDGLLIVVPSHVDPGYNGPLTARIINLLDKDYRLAANLHILTIRFCQLQNKTDQGYTRRVSREERVLKAIRESRDTLNKLFLREEDLLLKKDHYMLAFIQALSWLALFIPVVTVLSTPISFFWKLGETISTQKMVLLGLATLGLGPPILIIYFSLWVKVIRVVRNWWQAPEKSPT